MEILGPWWRYPRQTADPSRQSITVFAEHEKIRKEKIKNAPNHQTKTTNFMFPHLYKKPAIVYLFIHQFFQARSTWKEAVRVTIDVRCSCAK